MPTRQLVLDRLEQACGNFLSGEQLAQELKVSRAAIWKAVNQLKKEGYPITAVTNRGYALDVRADILSEQGVRAALLPQYNQLPIRVYKELASTNLQAKQLALKGAPNQLVVLCDQQTEGRGRYERPFVSPEGGIYMSVLLRPHPCIHEPVLLTIAAAVAVSEALEALCEETICIKWVNDLYCKGKKICGILTEAITDFESGAINEIVLGIGINYTTPSTAFSEELRSIAGSLYPNGNPPVSRVRVVAEILNRLLPMWENLDQKQFLEKYRKRCYILGQEVVVLSAQESYPARALDIDIHGRLVVELPDHTRQVLRNGEISVHPTQLLAADRGYE
ncbi:MAG: biotin--[acetyl-CoA-carboxylase] ligase [Anaerotruncus sp.]|nr:biotin--[acetyl-CoA-carboxylase] ligase [Anaerotruncus sp.]